jgi:hypothetical protein
MSIRNPFSPTPAHTDCGLYHVVSLIPTWTVTIVTIQVIQAWGRSEVNIEIYLQEIVCEGLDYIHLTQCSRLMNTVMDTRFA